MMSSADQVAARFEAVAAYVVAGDKVLVDFIALVKSRIECEEQNLAALSRLGRSVWTASAAGTMFEAINAFQCDALNNAKVKGEFVESLRIDVLEALSETQRTNSKINAKLMQQGRDAIKVQKSATERCVKAALKCDKAQREAAELRERLMEARASGATASGASVPLSPSQMAKLVDQVNDKMDEATDAQLRHEEARSALLQIRQAFDIAMREVVSGLEARDEARASTMKSALRRHLVVETSFLANRQYDTQNLVSVFEDISPAKDFQAVSHSSSLAAVEAPDDADSTNAGGSAAAATIEPSAAAIAAAASISPPASDEDVCRPPPYISQQRRKAAHKRKPKDLVEDLTSWMGPSKAEQAVKDSMVDDFEELYLGDLIGRLAEKHDLSSIEMKRLNTTLAALKQQAPFALLRVFLHYTRETRIQMVDHAFDFFAQLLKNMMRKFMHLQDMVAAKLVTSIAENITRLDAEDNVADILEENEDTAPILEWQATFFDACEANASDGGVADQPEDILQRHYSIFVDTHNVDPRQALRILSEIATACDDVIDPTRFAMWTQTIYLSLDPSSSTTSVKPVPLPASITNAAAGRAGTATAPVTNTLVSPPTFGSGEK